MFFLSGSTCNQSSTCLFCFIILYYFHKRKIRYTYPNLKINSRLHIFKNNLEIHMAFLSCFPSLPVGAHWVLELIRWVTLMERLRKWHIFIDLEWKNRGSNNHFFKNWLVIFLKYIGFRKQWTLVEPLEYFYFVYSQSSRGRSSPSWRTSWTTLVLD